MQEKRFHQRSFVTGTVRIWEKDAPDKVTECQLHTFCYGGFSVMAPSAFAVGLHVCFELSTPSLLRPLPGAAEVRYVLEIVGGATRAYRVGCHFTNVDTTSLLILINTPEPRNTNQPPRRSNSSTEFGLPM